MRCGQFARPTISRTIASRTISHTISIFPIYRSNEYFFTGTSTLFFCFGSGSAVTLCASNVSDEEDHIEQDVTFNLLSTTLVDATEIMDNNNDSFALLNTSCNEVQLPIHHQERHQLQSQAQSSVLDTSILKDSIAPWNGAVAVNESALALGSAQLDPDDSKKAFNFNKSGTFASLQSIQDSSESNLTDEDHNHEIIIDSSALVNNTTIAMSSPDLPSFGSNISEISQEFILPDDNISEAFQYNWASSCLDVMRGMKKYERRPMMSIATTICSKYEMGHLLQDRITNNEWSQAAKHAKYPGKGYALLPKPKYHRKRFDEEVVKEFSEWLYSNDFLQSLSFGQKVIQYYNGVHTVVEAVALTSNRMGIVQRYAEAFIQDSSSDKEQDCEVIRHAVNDDAVNTDEDTQDRCFIQCTKSRTQCMKPKDHKGRHAFTPKQCLSASSITMLLKQLTSGKIKSLAGLDDTDTKCGTNNFANMRAMVETLVGVVGMERYGFDKCELLKQIKKAEEFHKIGFVRHLGQGEQYLLQK